LSANGATALDSFTPANQDELNSTDMDLGSTAPAMLPTQTKSQTPLLAVQGGKDGILRLLDRRHLGGVGGELADVSIGDGTYAQPAVANDAHGVTWLFVGTASAVRAFRVVTTVGTTRLVSAWKSAVGGTSPAVANGLVFVAADGAVRALDARNGEVRWSGAIGSIHWESPIVANGRVYVSDESGTLFAFGM
jgi:outer membrane protein assembly factor BamB